MDGSRDPALDAARYRATRGDEPAADVDVARMAAEQEAREREERLAERRRRDRAATQHLWVERRIREAQERGDFENLPGAGKPIPGLTSGDPDWWVKALVEREQLTDLGPESVRLRRDDRDLDAQLDAMRDPADVRAALQEFNSRILAARAAPAAGPPLVTPTRDVEAEIQRWQARRGTGSAR